jgi:magnesium transporter
MIHTRMLTGGGEYAADVAADQLHPLVEDRSNVIWLDLESPTADELSLVSSICGWDHLTVEDLARQGQRAKLEQYDDYALLVMHVLAYGGSPSRLSTIEVDFVIGPNYVATVHYDAVPHITDSRDLAQHMQVALKGGRDYLLYVLTDQLVDSYFPVLDTMHESVEDLEDQIITDPRDTLMARIFDMKRDAVTLRKVVSPQLEVFTRLTSPGYGVVAEELQRHFRDVHDHLIRVFEAMDSYRELMSGALDAYLSTVSNRMNEVMKRLTVMAALFLPITFITGVFGMNLRKVPLWEDNLFWVFISAMLLMSVAQFWYFRRKRWV